MVAATDALSAATRGAAGTQTRSIRFDFGAVTGVGNSYCLHFVPHRMNGCADFGSILYFRGKKTTINARARGHSGD